MTTLKQYTVHADRATGAWIGKPQYVREVDSEAWAAQSDTEDRHFDRFEHEGEPCAIEVVWAPAVVRRVRIVYSHASVENLTHGVKTIALLCEIVRSTGLEGHERVQTLIAAHERADRDAKSRLCRGDPEAIDAAIASYVEETEHHYQDLGSHRAIVTVERVDGVPNRLDC